MKTPLTSHKRVRLKTLVDTFVNKCTRVNRKQKAKPKWFGVREQKSKIRLKLFKICFEVIKKIVLCRYRNASPVIYSLYIKRLLYTALHNIKLKYNRISSIFFLLISHAQVILEFIKSLKLHHTTPTVNQ
jgi:hypothetical protein